MLTTLPTRVPIDTRATRLYINLHKLSAIRPFVHFCACVDVCTTGAIQVLFISRIFYIFIITLYLQLLSLRMWVCMHVCYSLQVADRSTDFVVDSTAVSLSDRATEFLNATRSKLANSKDWFKFKYSMLEVKAMPVKFNSTLYSAS